MGGSVSLRGNTFSMEMHALIHFSYTAGTGNEYRDILDYTVKNSININTGVVEEVRFDFEYERYEEYDYVVDYDETGYFHFLMTSGGAFVIPFDWTYSILGISSIAVVVFLIRRKK